MAFPGGHAVLQRQRFVRMASTKRLLLVLGFLSGIGILKGLIARGLVKLVVTWMRNKFSLKMTGDKEASLQGADDQASAAEADDESFEGLVDAAGHSGNGHAQDGDEAGSQAVEEEDGAAQREESSGGSEQYEDEERMDGAQDESCGTFGVCQGGVSHDDTETEPDIQESRAQGSQIHNLTPPDFRVDQNGSWYLVEDSAWRLRFVESLCNVSVSVDSTGGVRIAAAASDADVSKALVVLQVIEANRENNVLTLPTAPSSNDRLSHVVQGMRKSAIGTVCRSLLANAIATHEAVACWFKVESTAVDDNQDAEERAIDKGEGRQASTAGEAQLLVIGKDRERWILTACLWHECEKTVPGSITSYWTPPTEHDREGCCAIVTELAEGGKFIARIKGTRSSKIKTLAAATNCFLEFVGQQHFVIVGTREGRATALGVLEARQVDKGAEIPVPASIMPHVTTLSVPKDAVGAVFGVKATTLTEVESAHSVLIILCAAPSCSNAVPINLAPGLDVEGLYFGHWFKAKVLEVNENGAKVQWAYNKSSVADLSNTEIRAVLHGEALAEREQHDKCADGKTLVIVGRQENRAAAALRLMKIVENRVPRTYTELDIGQLSTALGGAARGFGEHGDQAMRSGQDSWWEKRNGGRLWEGSGTSSSHSSWKKDSGDNGWESNGASGAASSWEKDGGDKSWERGQPAGYEPSWEQGSGYTYGGKWGSAHSKNRAHPSDQDESAGTLDVWGAQQAGWETDYSAWWKGSGAGAGGHNWWEKDENTSGGNDWVWWEKRSSW